MPPVPREKASSVRDRDVVIEDGSRRARRATDEQRVARDRVGNVLAEREVAAVAIQRRFFVGDEHYLFVQPQRLADLDLRSRGARDADGTNKDRHGCARESAFGRVPGRTTGASSLS